MLKKILIGLFVIALCGFAVGAYLWNKPAPKAENQDAVKVEATTLFNAYAQNAKQADSVYLDKWLEVTGTIQSVETNQDGQQVWILETGDMMQAVMCVMRDKGVTEEKGKTVTVKGRCTGLVNDVIVKDCIRL